VPHLEDIFNYKVLKPILDKSDMLRKLGKDFGPWLMKFSVLVTISHKIAQKFRLKLLPGIRILEEPWKGLFGITI